jgi:hypothetical protein
MCGLKTQRYLVWWQSCADSAPRPWLSSICRKIYWQDGCGNKNTTFRSAGMTNLCSRWRRYLIIWYCIKFDIPDAWTVTNIKKLTKITPSPLTNNISIFLFATLRTRGSVGFQSESYQSLKWTHINGTLSLWCTFSNIHNHDSLFYIT